VVEGGSGTDTLQFNGSNIGEDMALSASGSHALFTRNVAAITMDLNEVEHIRFAALGAADNITVNDLTGTDVTQVDIDLAASAGGATGDGANDQVTVNGTAGNDVISLSMRNGALVVSGLAEEVVIEHFDLTDEIHIAGLGGDDIIDASALGAGGPHVTLEGGEGDDVLLGSAGDDTLLGNAGDDILLGGLGNDLLDGGPGNNVVIQDATVAPQPGSSSPDFSAYEMTQEQADVAALQTDHPLL
jgi:Ca2+-binding RTX toxin-like protein